MKTVKLHVQGKSLSYPIFISPSNWVHARSFIKKNLNEKRLFIVTNAKLKRLYGRKISAVFGKNLKLIWILIRDLEKNKTLTTCEKILTALSRKKANRKSMLMAFGGGVIGDITGLAAAIYMRGVGYFQMPTSLLAQVDASIGGKTGVDLKTGKNLVGAFHQPKAVFIFSDFLKTLPPREIRCGLAEVVKYGLIADPGLFYLIQKNTRAVLRLDPGILTEIIFRCVKIKARIVQKDEKEKALRAILNFGHTIGHAIEALHGFQSIKHGEAVSIGMVYAAVLSYKRGFSQKDHTCEIKGVLKGLRLPTKAPRFLKKQYEKFLARDKKSGGETLRFVILEKIGKAKIVPLSVREITKYL